MADRRRIRDAGSAFSHIADQYQKARQERDKLAFQIKKQEILSKMRSEQSMDNFKKREEYKQKMKVADPAQTFLKNRFESERPLDTFELPEDEEKGVAFPADRVAQTSTGKYTTVKNEPKDLDLLLINKVEKMREQGKPISDVWEKRAQAAKNRLPKSAGYYKEPAEDFSSVASHEPKKRTLEKGPNKATQKVLDGIAADISERKTKGDFNTDDIMDELDKNSDSYVLRGVDVGYIRKKLGQIPQAYKKERKKLFGRFGKESPAMEKRGGKWFKKVGNDWELADEAEA